MWDKFVKDDKGFTGLEAAIVLVAFVVVAAVFSYVMLGAGFYTTQKSQEVVHTGVAQASSSVELSGDLVAYGDTSTNPDELKNVTMFLQLTSGGSPVDMSKTLLVYSSPTVAPTELNLSISGTNLTAADATHFGIVERYNDNEDLLIDRGEKFEVKVETSTFNIIPNSEFQIEIKPPQGATYSVRRQAPPSIGTVMSLV